MKTCLWCVITFLYLCQKIKKGDYIETGNKKGWKEGKVKIVKIKSNKGLTGLREMLCNYYYFFGKLYQ